LLRRKLKEAAEEPNAPQNIRAVRRTRECRDIFFGAIARFDVHAGRSIIHATSVGLLDRWIFGLMELGCAAWPLIHLSTNPSIQIFFRANLLEILAARLLEEA